MTNQNPIEHYLAEREQLIPARLLLSGYAPLAFVICTAIQLLAPIALLLGFPAARLAESPWLGGLAQDPATPEVGPECQP